jgi:hypothetical protein
MKSLQRRKKRSGRPPVQKIVCDDTLPRKETQTNREQLNHDLQCIGKELGMELRINRRGASFFQYGRFVVVIEAPKEPSSSSFFLYTSLLRCASTSISVLRKALELNYLNQETRGCTLALNPTCEDENELEVTLCYAHPIMGLNQGELGTIVKNFMGTASNLHQHLTSSQTSSKVDTVPMVYKRLPKREPQRMPSTPGGRKPPTVGSVPKLYKRRSIQPPQLNTLVPAPPQEDVDATPIISNKSLDRKIFIDPPPAPSNDPKLSNRRSKSIQSVKTFTKGNMTLGLATSTYSYETKKDITKKRSKVIGRLNRMASLTLSRPGRLRRTLSRSDHPRRQHATEIVVNT